jgi:hypothetical protein
MRNAILVALRCGLLVVAAAIFAGAWAATLDGISACPADDRALVGTVAPGEMLRAGTTIVNDTDSRLIINHRTTQCDCGELSAATWIVPPRQAQFVSGKVAAPVWAGLFRRRVEFETSDPLRPKRAIEVVGFVDETRPKPSAQSSP